VKFVKKAIFAIVHATILVTPAIAFGHSEEATRARAVVIVFFLLLLAAIESPVIDRPQRDGRGLALLSSFGLLVTAWLAIGERGSQNVASWLGIVPVLSGIALRASALRALGSGFSSAIDPGPVLVVRGVYGHVRHPSDLGLLLLSTGIAVLGESLVAGVAVLVVGLSVGLRIRREEAALSERFQGAHAFYRRRVRALLPRMASARMGC
jgi:protein-S-isoprenylcysteine O-methyltransferase Ste14